MADGAAMSVTPRASRLLSLLALARKQGGTVKIEEAAAILGLPADSLGELADELMAVGVPPWSPADFLELSLERGHLRVDLDLGLGGPLRLSASEAAVLVACLGALKRGAATPLAQLCDSAREKLRSAVMPDEDGHPPDESARIAWAAEPGNDPTLLDDAHRAATEGRVVRLRYWNASRGEVQDRTAQAVALIWHTGRWYIEGMDAGDGASRLFRLDRILGLLVGDPAPARPRARVVVARPVLFRPPEPMGTAVVRFDLDLCGRAHRLWPTARTLRRERDGAKVLALPIATEPALLRELFRMGTGWEIAQPASLRALAVAWAGEPG